MSNIEGRLTALGIQLPQAAAPAANYIPYNHHGDLILTSGQLPLRDGKLIATGILGRDLATDQGQLAAKWCAINILAQLKAAAGDLERITGIVKITVFVASTADYTEQHLVANGASDLLAEIFGDNGRHARSAVGVASLPLDAPVEIEAIAALK